MPLLGESGGKSKEEEAMWSLSYRVPKKGTLVQESLEGIKRGRKSRPPKRNKGGGKDGKNSQGKRKELLATECAVKENRGKSGTRVLKGIPVGKERGQES